MIRFKHLLVFCVLLVMLAASAGAETIYYVDQPDRSTDVTRKTYSISTGHASGGFGQDAYAIDPDSSYVAPREDASSSTAEFEETVTPVIVDFCPNAAPGRMLSVVDADSPVHISTRENGTYPPEDVLDNDNTTSWQFDVEDTNDLADAFIELELGQPSAVNKVLIKHGYRWIRYGLNQYDRNARPTLVELSFMYQNGSLFEDPVRIEIPDDWDDDEDPFFEMVFDWKLNVKEIRMRVVKYAEGSHFEDDVAVSEMRVSGLPMNEVPDNLNELYAHQIENRVLLEPTTQMDGVAMGVCTACGKLFEQTTIPRLSE